MGPLEAPKINTTDTVTHLHAVGRWRIFVVFSGSEERSWSKRNLKSSFHGAAAHFVEDAVCSEGLQDMMVVMFY